ncbi:hypothetical protein MHYP_G00104620 [Metynnis hypsauchen]
MKILLIFTLYLISDPCCLGSKTVSGYLGETVTISCLYPEEFTRNTKFFYQQHSKYFSEVIDTSETQRGRFSISDDRSSKVLSVRISDVREDDAGLYFCAVLSGEVSVSYETLYSETQLQVTAPGSSAIIIIIIVSVGVGLLLTGGSTLIFYKRRDKKRKEQLLSDVHCPGHHADRLQRDQLILV